MDEGSKSELGNAGEPKMNSTLRVSLFGQLEKSGKRLGIRHQKNQIGLPVAAC